VEDRITDLVVGAGFDEAITWSFVSPSRAAMLRGLGGERRPIPLRNPLTEEWSVLRTGLLPGLVEALAANLRRGVEGVSLFEVGRAFWEGERRGPVPGSTDDGVDGGLAALPAEPLLLGMAASASDGAASVARIRHLQALVVRLAAELGAGAVETEPADVPGLRRGRGGRLVCNALDVGLVGELDAPTAARFDMRGRVTVAEVNLDLLIPEHPAPRRYRPPPRYPAVVQDLAVTVPEEARAGDALQAIREAGGALLDSAVLYDQYRGPSLGAGRKGWTFRLSYRAADRTLTSEEAQGVQEAISAALRARCAAEVRR
jgi:phenylalanyl-tRNA synthetase beta chain